ncbi:FAD/NAD(P)-binding domain-containing protein [Mycena venus]|uniref:FAD/NAD(P)-binding domain-containing protein n=1 Tax=Mycena venus TaxID=2733690 RepID=A0A8H7CWR3_9AGAR|nr:FAD/NAD(P)-binding domain-containing protein [Mycena venus]
MAAHESKSKPLRIGIVGAGIAGLAAAAAFRKEGHEVQIFESSSMNKEIGAAIGVTANSLRVLTYQGFDIKNLRAVDYLGMHVYFLHARLTWLDSNGCGRDSKFDILEDPHNTFGRPGIFCHRSDLHDELKRLATMEERPGIPATIHLKSKVESCDPATGKLVLKDGEIHHVDLIIGADGIHSTIRTIVLGYEQRALASGRVAFRCLLETSKLEGREEFDWLLSGMPGARGVSSADGSGRYLFVYLCRDNTLVNIVAHYPDRRDQEKYGKSFPSQIIYRKHMTLSRTLDWNAPATKEELVAEFSDYSPEYKGLLELVDGPVHLWQIRALPCLPTWINGCAALIGDAAHATFPTLGQGAGMAIEDAATLACLLPLGTRTEEIPRRLEAYQTLRKARGEFVLTESVEQVIVPSKRGLYSKSREMQAFIVGHDAVKVAQEYFATHFST